MEPSGSAGVTPPRFLADEMLGRLARYLRMTGCDTVYVRGWSDEEIARRAEAEQRILLTRDRALADRVTPSVLLRTVAVAEQWAEVRRARADLPAEVSFERCTLCNGPLRPAPRPSGHDASGSHEEPGDRPIFECTVCAHRYWEGSHTRRVREAVRRWALGALG